MSRAKNTDWVNISIMERDMPLAARLCSLRAVHLLGVGCLVLAFMIAGWVCSFSFVQAANGINRQISYQGKLLDSTGIPVANGTYQMKFSLYAASSGGTALWNASGTTLAVSTAIPVTVQSGLFSVLLGDTSAAGGWQNALDGVDWNSDSLYLGVTIGSDAEMTPRKRLGAVPQAFNAEKLQGMSASSTVSGGQTLFTVNQTENNAATGTRTALLVRSNGTSNANDYLLRGVNDAAAEVFSLNRQGSVTSSGVFAFSGSGTSTVNGSVQVGGAVSSTSVLAEGYLTVNGTVRLGDQTSDSVYVNGRIATSLVPTTDNTFSLGSSSLRWSEGNFVNVSSTNATSTYLYSERALITNTTSTNLYTNRVEFQSASGSSLALNQLTLRSTLEIPSVSTTAVFTRLLQAESADLTIRATSSIPLVSSQTLSGDAANLYLNDRFLIATHIPTDQFTLFDITSSTHPVNLGLTNFPDGYGALTHLVLQGNLLYASFSTSRGLHIFDLGSGLVTEMASTTFSSVPRSFSIQGKYAYVFNGDDSFRIVDISNPRKPALISTTAPGYLGHARKIIVRGRYLYLLYTSAPQINVFDVIDPYHPVALGTVGISQDVDLLVEGSFLYAGGLTGLETVSVRTPASPVYQNANNVGSIQSLAKAGRYIFAAVPASGVRVLDVENPASIQMLQTLGSSISAQGVAVNGRALYVTDSNSNQLLVYRLPGVEMASFEAGEGRVGQLYVMADGRIANSLDVGNQLVVGYGGLRSDGPLSISALNTTSSILGNLTIGTSTQGIIMHPSFGLTGDDLFVAGNIGSASSVYTNGAFIAGIGTSYASSSLTASSDFMVTSTGGLFIGSSTGTVISAASLQLNAAITALLNVSVSSTAYAASFVNRADHASQTSSWGAYIDRLLVGPSNASTGTSNYAMLVNYDVANVHGICLARTSSVSCPDNGASVYSLVADDTISSSNAFDLAESYTLEGVATSSDVLVFGSASATMAQSSGVPYDPRIAGVYSSRPGFLLGILPEGIPVALTGRVPTKVSTVNGAIAIGDPLTTSEYPGVAMKATKPGMILGYALESASADTTIEVFVKTGYSAGTILNTDGRVARLTDDLVVDARRSVSASTPTADSWGITFRGAAWDGGQISTPSFGLFTQVTTPTSSSLVITNSSSTVFAIDQGGAATIAGDLAVSGRLYPSGRGAAQRSKYIFVDDTSTSTQYIATNADGWQANDAYDFAERYYSPDRLETGDLVIASDRGQFHVQRSLNENGFLMGIVSTRPAFVAGRPDPNTYPIALAGRVPTKVSTINGVIRVGDALAPSTIPGTAVKATKAGPIVGLALEAYDAATVGKIEVFVNPGWWGGPERETVNANRISSGLNAQTVAEVSYRGFALVESGSQRVHVAYDSVLSYPNIQVTPRGEVHGGWWTDNYTDIGFDIFLREEQRRDVTFAWTVQGTPNGARIYRSDGTYALVNVSTGEAIVQTAATTTDPQASVAPPDAILAVPATESPSSSSSASPMVTKTESSSSSTTLVSPSLLSEAVVSVTSSVPVPVEEEGTSAEHLPAVPEEGIVLGE